jgi:hypothetical protein
MFNLLAISNFIRNFAAVNSAKVGCTLANKQFPAFGLRHHCR